ncbi:hypothetical protein [Flavobacterium sp.]|uniref:hypothetical protein n=1 Tax=Flavobacterium sp. TaxID=239 RepID=UPI00375303D4
MIKKILLSSFLFLSLQSFAQESTASPYSFYGVGEIKFKGTIENKAMGGIGILLDSIRINLQNPATYSHLKRTAFALAGTYSNTTLKNSTDKEETKRTTLDYIAVAFPSGKLGLSAGLMPYSSVGYKIQNANTTDAKIYKGSGGLSRAYIGAAYQITPKLSFGVDLGYNFGTIETNAILLNTNTQYGTRELNTSDLNGVNINTGLIYQTKLQKLDVVSSLMFTPSTALNVNNTRNTALITYGNAGEETVYGNPNVFSSNNDIKLPSKVAFGAGLGKIKKWFVGFESSFIQSKNSGNLYTLNSNATFEDATKIAVGGYYIPNYNSYSNLFKKITYRAGFRYENTGLIVNSKAINDAALTLGFGIPVGGNFSSLNLGVELGKKGTTDFNLIQENYINLSIGFSFSDRWFVKRKFD